MGGIGRVERGALKLAVVLVHYRTPQLVPVALAALRADAEASRIELEIVLVDNGSTPTDRALFADLGVRVTDPGSNLGYAGGANRGLRQTSADVAMVMNPDVIVGRGCLDALLDALATGADVAGPRFFWDEERSFLLPPTEKRSRFDELCVLAARLGRGWARFARRRWRRHAHRHWLADRAMTSFELSGALLAFRRDVWAKVGFFDEEYRLYFEETDWLERLRSAGGEARQIPDAAAVHLYAQSTVGEAWSSAWFLESERRFRCLHYGAWFNRFLEASGRHLPAARREESAIMTVENRFELTVREQEQAAWLEISLGPLGFPAAARRLTSRSMTLQPLPESLWQRLSPASYGLRTIDLQGRELALRTLVKNRWTGPDPVHGG